MYEEGAPARLDKSTVNDRGFVFVRWTTRDIYGRRDTRARVATRLLYYSTGKRRGYMRGHLDNCHTPGARRRSGLQLWWSVVVQSSKEKLLNISPALRATQLVHGRFEMFWRFQELHTHFLALFQPMPPGASWVCCPGE